VKSELQEAELSGEEDLSSSGGSRGKTLNRAQRSSTRVAQVVRLTETRSLRGPVLHTLVQSSRAR
jgi:hypothetical protein